MTSINYINKYDITKLDDETKNILKKIKCNVMSREEYEKIKDTLPKNHIYIDNIDKTIKHNFME